MTTAILVPPVPTEGEARVVMHDVGWEGYEAILNLVGERRSPRLAYLKGDLELMSPGFLHETIAERLGSIAYEVAMGLDIPFQPAATTTFRRRDMERGLQGDKSYYLANEYRVRDKDEIDLDVDPPPDLAIEVEITRSATDRMAIYAGLGVPEVWRSDGQTLHFLRLGPAGTYTETSRSLAFPFLTSEEVHAWMLRPQGVGETQWLRQVRDWVRDTLAARPRA